MNYLQWLKSAEQQLKQTLKNDPYLDAYFDVHLLLQQATGKSKSAILAFPEATLSESQEKQLDHWLVRRLQGEPIAYILGSVGFWDLELKVSPQTLIPRPDTEILVETALDLIRQQKTTLYFPTPLRILDLGTGTGAIILAISQELKKCGVDFQSFGVDLFDDVIALARENAEQNQLSEVHFFPSSWFDNVKKETTEKFHFIVSNPPYIDENDENLMVGDVQFEPRSALVAEENGLSDLKKIIFSAPHFLYSEGYLLLEHGWQQGEAVRALFAEQGWQQIQTVKDYGGNDRITLAQIK